MAPADAEPVEESQGFLHLQTAALRGGRCRFRGERENTPVSCGTTRWQIAAANSARASGFLVNGEARGYPYR
jgi:hypothetical protein